MITLKRLGALALSLGTLVLTGSSTSAQMAEEVEISRDAVDIARPHPEPAAVESVLVFSNRGVRPQRVRCLARNQRGEVVGRIRTWVPALGLRYVLASDFGGAFLGRARCTTRGRIVGSGFLVAPGLSNLPAETHASRRYTAIDFHVLSYQP